MKKSKTKSAKRARERREKERKENEAKWKAIRDAQDAANRAAEEDAARAKRRQIEGPCPRCSHTPLTLYDNELAMEPGINRYDLVRTTTSDAVYEVVEWTRSVDVLIYCPNCGALHEIGGETTYPDSGVKGLPKEEPESDVITEEDMQAQAQAANHVRKLFENL